jgi:hypothetical protein
MDSRAISGVVGESNQNRAARREGCYMQFDINNETVTNLIRNIARQVKLERLKQPYSMLSPEPYQFQRFSKLDRPWLAVPVEAKGLELELLHDSYGMPRDIPQMILTISGSEYGQEFADFSVELFGLKGETDHPDEINRLSARDIGDNITVSNAAPDTIPFGAGASLSITNKETGECIVRIYVWRWRVFMDNSSLCLENNWHRNDLTGGGWIPFVLGIVYDNPDKMVDDTRRFAPAFKLCNLVEADLSERRGGYLIKNIKAWTAQAVEIMAQESQQAGKIIPYSFVRFSKAFPLSTTRPNIYNLLTPQERDGLSDCYLKRCTELITK